MKRQVYLLLLVMGTATTLYAQNKLVITYDPSGNQLERSYCNGCANQSSAQRITLDSIPALVDETPKATDEDSILILPNPTEGEVALSWTADFGQQISYIKIVGYHTRFEKNLPYQKNQQALTIDLSREPSSVYIVQFHLNDGSFITKKIIKK